MDKNYNGRLKVKLLKRIRVGKAFGRFNIDEKSLRASFHHPSSFREIKGHGAFGT